jgi:O-acetyl-ADP-ribose deacetylase (regulator of RNase III)
MKKGSIELIKGDITSLEADAIVNAANTSLLGGGGVDGAIHKAAGPGLLEECKMLNGCETGQSKITGGHGLKARHIIHTVGPVWQGGQHNECSLLASCYQTTLSLASDNKLESIAFPAISTGIYRFPVELAALIAVNETKRFLKKHNHPGKVIFVTFSDENYETYRKALNQ